MQPATNTSHNNPNSPTGRSARMTDAMPAPLGGPASLSLRAVKSVGSLRTPHASSGLQDDHQGDTTASTSLPTAARRQPHVHSLSPPDLSFSRSTLLSGDESEFMSRARSGTTSTSPGKLAGDSWNSRMSARSGILLPSNHGHPSSASNGNHRGATHRVRLDSVFGPSLPGFPYINSTAAIAGDPRARRSWNNKNNPGAPHADMAAQDRSGSARLSLSVEGDTSCSGGSNSSEDVDLDLSWDVEQLRARQLATLRAAEEARQQQSSPSAHPPVAGTSRAAHVGIDMPVATTQMLPHQASEEYRRYRLAGKKRMSRSAVELRQQAQAHGPTADILAASLAPRLSIPQKMRESQSPGSAIAESPLPPPGNQMGWSFAATPPLSPSELVTFAENAQEPKSHFHAFHAEGTKSFALLRKRRPSFPLMSLLDKALRHDPSADSPGNDSTSSFGSPALTQTDPSAGMRDTLVSTSPVTSGWSSPRSPDEIATPKTGEFHPVSEFANSSGSSASPHLRNSSNLRHQAVSALAKEEKRNSAPVPVGHTRRSSSIFRLPFGSLLGSLRAATPINATGNVAVQSIPEGHPPSPSGSLADPPSEENRSQESHSQESAQTSSPPRLGATSSARISDSMMRPGPTIGQGRLAGLGLTFPAGRQRQSSLPILSFSSPPEEAQARLDGGNAVEVLRPSSSAGPASAPAGSLSFAALHLEPGSPRSPIVSRPNVDQLIEVQDEVAKRPRKPVTSTRRPGFNLVDKIDSIRPSQILFFSAFLLGPWCFIVGGWFLRSIDGEFPSVKGVRCRCPADLASCECHAEIYRQIRLLGGRQTVLANSHLQTQKMDRFVLANRIAALSTGTATLVLAVTALIVLARAW